MFPCGHFLSFSHSSFLHNKTKVDGETWRYSNVIDTLENHIWLFHYSVFSKVLCHQYTKYSHSYYKKHRVALFGGWPYQRGYNLGGSISISISIRGAAMTSHEWSRYKLRPPMQVKPKYCGWSWRWRLPLWYPPGKGRGGGKGRGRGRRRRRWHTFLGSWCVPRMAN